MDSETSTKWKVKTGFSDDEEDGNEEEESKDKEEAKHAEALRTQIFSSTKKNSKPINELDPINDE